MSGLGNGVFGQYSTLVQIARNMEIERLFRMTPDRSWRSGLRFREPMKRTVGEAELRDWEGLREDRESER